jgi:hypothetical protein
LILTINSILHNSEAKSIIYRYLLDAGILFRFYVTIRLFISYSKQQHNIEAIKIIRDIVKLPHTKTETEFREELHNDAIKFNQMDKKLIKQEAQIWAKMKIDTLNADDFFILYTIGAIYYYVNLLNHLFIFSCPVASDD